MFQFAAFASTYLCIQYGMTPSHMTLGHQPAIASEGVLVWLRHTESSTRSPIASGGVLVWLRHTESHL